MSDNMALLEGLAQLGAHFTPVNFMGKNPIARAWQTKPVPYANIVEMLNGETPINVSILLGSPSNGIVDVDLDTPAANLLADLWLPSTGLIFGRASTPKAHRLYQVDNSEMTKVVGYNDPTSKKKILELRSTGGHTVIPPSTHEEGELIEWHTAEGITQIDYQDLQMSVQRLAVACFWADRWATMVENRVTHTTNIALAGALARSGVPEEVTYKIVESGCIYYGEDKSGFRDQLTTVTDTYRRYEDYKNDIPGADPITGWPTLAEMLNQKELKFIRSMLMIAEPETDFERSDAYNAGILVREHGNDMKFHVEEQVWYVWNGQYWEKDEGQAALQKAMTVGSVIEREIKEAQPDRHKAMRAAAIASRNHGKLTAMLKVAQSDPKLHLRNREENLDSYKLNMQNGTLDLRTGAIDPFDRMDLITKIGGATYNPNAHGTRFHDFLVSVIPDRELRKWVQKAMGYSILGLTDEEVYFMPFGSGQNGKGTLMNVIDAVLGDYCQQARVTSFLTSSRNDNIRQDLAEMATARVVLASEPSEGQALDPSIIKDITGGDAIRSRFLYGREFQYTPKFALWMSANHKPRTSAFDPAIWRRVRVIPFVVNIPMDQRDEGLKKFLSTDTDSLSAVLNWLVEGAQMWQADRLGSCQAVDEANAQYRFESNSVAQFISDFCEITGKTGDNLPKVRLMSYYNEWVKTANLRAVKRSQFELAIMDMPGVGETSDGKSWTGIRTTAAQANNSFSSLFAVS